MPNGILLSVISVSTVLLCLISAIQLTEALEFQNAYIQNMKSGRCLTTNTDLDDYPLTSNQCKCGPYQFWRLDDDNRVANELAQYGYLDQLWAGKTNGEYSGIYAYYNANYEQIWKIDQHDNGNYVFKNKQTEKCLREVSTATIAQWDCDDADQSQQWKIINNACGKPAKIPTGRFQLQNPATGKCAVIKDNSNALWGKIVGHDCSCENDYHYWKYDKKTLITEAKASGQCLANWDYQSKYHAGVTQCSCVYDAQHSWRFSPFDDGTFNLINVYDGRCAYLGDGGNNTDIMLDHCDRNNEEFRWRFYDECKPEPVPPPIVPPTPTPPSPQPQPPQPVNTIPYYLTYFFESGNMNWLTPQRFTLLNGGRWDSTSSIWYTSQGTEIHPNTQLWTTYFGQDVQPSFLNVLFPNGQTWNDVFGWMTIDFFNTWTPPKSQCEQLINVPYIIPA